MPYPPSSRNPAGPRRRSLFASAAAAALLTGCTDGAEESDGGRGGSPSAADRARASAARDSGRLIERYDAVLAAHPALARRLEPLRAEVVRHRDAFGETSRTASATATASPSGSASASPSAPAAVPADEKAALAELAAAERTLADRRAKALLEVPGELARLLASVAAAGAAHAYLLTETAK
ncbi:hypothetical protein ACWC10_07220 [Streptomyces sp. NPDC001595]|uniref:hypothetical protein n=1 Tax=Streptomyces sp. NPDC001532 TaxID=3154520 RepID=UPI0033228920